MTIPRIRESLLPSLAETTAAWRRVFDILVAGTGLVLAAPIMILASAAIWLDDGGPILFSQMRLGLHGRRFLIYKFRKFHKDCGTSGRQVTITGDARMTRLGRILERTKIDELPQLWNILKGDMSVVGPRPESLAFVDQFSGPYLLILDHKPGIFGPNQCLFRNEGFLYRKNADPERFYRDVLFPIKARIDLEYFAHRTFGKDLGCIFWNMRAVVGIRAPLPTGWQNLVDDALRAIATPSGPSVLGYRQPVKGATRELQGT